MPSYAENEATLKIRTEFEDAAFEQMKQALRDYAKAQENYQKSVENFASDNTLKNFRAMSKARNDMGLQQVKSDRQMAASAKQLGMSVEEVVESLKAQVSAQSAAAAGSAGLGNSLIGLAGKYGTLGFAIKKVMDGYADFSDRQERLRVVQARAGASNAQMQRTHDELRKVANASGNTVEEVLKIEEAFREAGYTGIEFSTRMTGAISKMAETYGVSGEALATSLGAFMQQLNISAAHVPAALDLITTKANSMRLNLEQLTRFAPQLAEQMRNLGATDLEGLNTTISVLGHLQKGFGTTYQAARAMSQMLYEIESGGGLMSVMKMDAEAWARNQEQIVSGGGNFFDWYFENLAEARRRNYDWVTLIPSGPIRRIMKAIIEDEKGQIRTLDEIKKKSAEVMGGQGKDTDNAYRAIRRLSNEWNEFWLTVGQTADTFGLTALLDIVGKLVNAMNRLAATRPDQAAASMQNTFSKFGIGGGPVEPPSLPEAEQKDANEELKDDILTSLGFPSSRRQSGGSAGAGKPYIVGEKGPELFVPGSSGRVLTKDEAIKQKYIGALRSGYKNTLDAWDSFFQYFNSIPRQEQETALYQFHRMVKPETQMAIDLVLGWGGAKKTRIGGVKTPQGLMETSIVEGILRQYMPRDQGPPVEPLLAGVKPGEELGPAKIRERLSIASFGGRRALGGDVAAGKSYLVGEAGPEILALGKTAGKVTGNQQIENMVRNTERSMDILDDIRDILQREEMERESAKEGGPGGPGTGTGTGAGTGTGTGAAGGGGGAGAGPQGPSSTSKGETPAQYANVRYNNPGAMYPGEAANKFGTTGTGIIGGGHKIAGFPTPVHGAAANMYNLSKNYRGMRIGAAIGKWSGNNRGTVPGYDSNQVITDEMLNDPKFMIPFMKAIAGGEAPGQYPMDEAQWQQAFNWYQKGGVPQGETAIARAGGSQFNPTPGATGVAGEPGPGGLTPPVGEGGKVISAIGDSRDGGRRRHMGTDFQAAMGAPIYATSRQTVTQSGWLGGNYGWGVRTRDENGTEHVYAHMAGDPGMQTGQSVGGGSRIGSVGMSGNARGTVPHVHYEMRGRGGYNDSINPLAAMGLERGSRIAAAKQQPPQQATTSNDTGTSGSTQVPGIPKEQVSQWSEQFKEQTTKPSMDMGQSDLDRQLEKLRAARQEFSEPLLIRTRLDNGPDSQHRRTAIDDQLRSSERDRAWRNNADIGIA